MVVTGGAVGPAATGSAAVATAEDDGTAWYVVHTKPRQEDRVVSWIRLRAALPTFCPKLAILRRRGARRVTLVEPLFPSYLFVRMTLDASCWDAVRWAPGVRRILGAEDTPSPVPPEAVRLLRARCGEDGIVRHGPQWRRGETVRVVRGPFEGLVGILDRPATRTHRVRVLLQLLGCPTPVELDVTDVERVA
jgi:transcriptional antiterminator RfaH